MRLLIEDNQGIVWDVTDGLEDYDLDKPLASSSVMGDIKSVLKSIKEDEADD